MNTSLTAHARRPLHGTFSFPLSTFAFRPHTTPSGKWGATAANLSAYDSWSAAQVRTEIARAGYRLAAILKKIWP